MSRIATVYGAFAFLILSGAFAFNADAVFVEDRLPDPVLEHRAREISEGIRCLVCQNQSIMDSNADLAKDLRSIVRERVAAGDSDDDVRNYLVSRYGDWVLLNPPLRLKTLLLWVSPLLMLLVGAVFMWRFMRSRSDKMSSAKEEPQPLTAEEIAELEGVMKSAAEKAEK